MRRSTYTPLATGAIWAVLPLTCCVLTTRPSMSTVCSVALLVLPLMMILSVADEGEVVVAVLDAAICVVGAEHEAEAAGVVVPLDYKIIHQKRLTI